MSIPVSNLASSPTNILYVYVSISALQEHGGI